MSKNYSFYRGILTRKQAVDSEPGLLAATEVVQAVCDAGFQRNGFFNEELPNVSFHPFLSHLQLVPKSSTARSQVTLPL